MSNDQPERQNDPDKLWEMIRIRDDEISELKAHVYHGHWYVGEVQTDARPTYRYSCQCGYKSNVREAISGHIEWKKAELQNSKGAE